MTPTPTPQENFMKYLLTFEPARIVALVTAIIAVAVAFGLNLTEAQTTAILGLAGLIVGAGEVTRSKVVPLNEHESAVDAALHTPVPPVPAIPEQREPEDHLLPEYSD